MPIRYPSPKLVWIVVCLFALAAPAKPQSSPITSPANGSITIDAAQLTRVIALDAPWRFSPTNDPRFADPAFDDSSWPLLKPDAPLPAAYPPNSAPGDKGWVRLHLHLLHANGPLAVIVTAQRTAQYAVFANGKQVGASRGFASNTAYNSAPTWIEIPPEIPPAHDITLAIHCVALRPGSPQTVPLKAIEIGQSEAVGALADLRHFRYFDGTWLSDFVLGLMFLGFTPVALALLFAQPRHREYLWLAIFCLCSIGDYILYPIARTGWMPLNYFTVHLATLCNSGALIAGLEFVAELAGLRSRWILRVEQACMLLVVFSRDFTSASVDQWFHDGQYALYIVSVVVILFMAYRRGRKECGLLLLAMSVDVPSLLFRFDWRIHLGGVGIAEDDISSTLRIGAVLAIVLYRFIRVSKDEEIAAAEFRAARTVQQLLIPETPPATPGFTVESVYIPAQQVGGDFFLVLPASENSADTSLFAVVGDVSGKGLQAAMVVATIMGGLRMQLSRAPADVLTSLNRLLSGHISGFATCCAVLIHSDGRMQIANAGNPAPYCDGEELDTLPGLPLGIDPDITYTAVEHTLPASSRLTFVSDGVLEATSLAHKELFGFDRTRAISTQSARAIADAACAFGAGAPLADDITVLSIRNTA